MHHLQQILNHRPFKKNKNIMCTLIYTHTIEYYPLVVSFIGRGIYYFKNNETNKNKNHSSQQMI